MPAHHLKFREQMEAEMAKQKAAAKRGTGSGKGSGKGVGGPAARNKKGRSTRRSGAAGGQKPLTVLSNKKVIVNAITNSLMAGPVFEAQRNQVRIVVAM